MYFQPLNPKIMKKVFFMLCCGAFVLSCNKPQESATPPPQTPVEPPQAELVDGRYAEIGKQGIAALAAGDIDKWMEPFADNARYLFNAGDSLVGKQAIADYWKDRRTNVIEKIEFTSDIWTPLKINKPQKGPDRAGVWLLCWYKVTASYKGGGTMSQWIHTDLHFDANDKIDLVVQYLDRAAIAAAMPKKK